MNKFNITNALTHIPWHNAIVKPSESLFLGFLKLSYWSDPKFWSLTILMILGWPPWPQGHRMVKIFQIGPQGPKLWIFEKLDFFEKLCCCFVRAVSYQNLLFLPLSILWLDYLFFHFKIVLHWRKINLSEHHFQSQMRHTYR